MNLKFKNTISSLILASMFFSMAPAAYALPVDPEFNPNKLIEDHVFEDTKTFGSAAGIQKFLESQKSVLANTNPIFLEKLKEPNIRILKEALEDPQSNLDRKRTAAELIWDASQTAGINPQVILVTLQKEQGLITNHQDSTDARLQKALDFALGFGCPDSTGCKESLFPGFYFQLFGNFDAAGNRYLGATKSLMKSFNVTTGRGPMVNGKIAQVGDTIELENTLGGYDGVLAKQLVTIGNRATAALYRYTPHVFNGNYNFTKFFKEWFRYANGTILKLGGDVNTYIIQNGSRLVLPNFVAQAQGLDLSKAITVSPNEIASYPQGEVMGPADNTVVKVIGDEKIYVFIDNKKHPASAFVLQQRGLNPVSALTITPTEAQYFEQGATLTPKDGSVLRGQNSPEVYLVENGNLKLFSAFTFQQRKAAGKMQVIPDSEILTYPKAGFVAPVDGTLVKTAENPTVYSMSGGLKHPISYEVFKNNGYSFKEIVTLSKDEVNGVAIGAFTTPKERSVFKVSDSGNVYLFKDGQKHLVSSFVGKQRYITPDFTVSPQEAGEWFDGIPIPPANGTALKGDKDATVYFLENAQLRPMTYKAFLNKKLTAKKIVVLPQAEVDGYAKGETLEK